MGADSTAADYEMDVAIVGGGACGMMTALRAARSGRLQIGVFERDAREMCNTQISSGSLAAGGTRFQRESGIKDSWQSHAEDVLRKNHGQADEEIVMTLCKAASEYVEWLYDEVHHPLELAKELQRIGHSTLRLHTDPDRSGGSLLVKSLRDAIARTPNIAFVDGTPGVGLDLSPSGSVEGIRIQEADGVRNVSSKATVLACDGFGANGAMVERYLPQIKDAVYIGVSNNRGDGINWGIEAGATVRHMGSYQGHGHVVRGYNTRVSPTVCLLGGLAINSDGRRFTHEDQGYSEFAAEILAQPHGWVVEVWDEAIMREVAQSELMRESASVGAFARFEDWASLGRQFRLPRQTLTETVSAYEKGIERGEDPFGNRHIERRLEPPLYAAKITGALAHTQGGLAVDNAGHVFRESGGVIGGLYAGGGTAAGISGDGADGYLSGNGLLSALGWGYVIGNHLAQSLQA